MSGISHSILKRQNKNIVTEKKKFVENIVPKLPNELA